MESPTTTIDELCMYLLENILGRLGAVDFASADCVSRWWHHVCGRVLCRPKLSSACSLYLSPFAAVEHVLNEILSEPIRPHFAIAVIYYLHFGRQLIHLLIADKLGLDVPIITIHSHQNIFGENIGGRSQEDMKEKGIMLTIGYLPGVKVKEISLLQKNALSKDPRAFMIDTFIKDIRMFSTSVSGRESPAAIMIFSKNPEGMIAVMRKLDYVMSPETVIVGAYGCGFQHTKGGSSAKIVGLKHVTAYALVFSVEKNKAGMGETKFHALSSSGLLPVGPVYAASVKKRHGFYTGITARIEGSREKLDGGTILSQAHEELGGVNTARPLCIGVTKRRKFSIGREKLRWIASLAFHEVVKINQGCLFVNDTDMDIKTGDTFRFYYPDPATALSSVVNVSNHLRSLKHKGTTRKDKLEVFGGLIFTSFGRGESFDSSLFMDNFTGVTPGATFYGRVFGRGDLTPYVDNSQFLATYSRVTCGTFCGWFSGHGDLTPYFSESEEGKWVRCCVHEHGALYLIMSYIP